MSELLDRVRKGDIVTITHRGEPVAEVRPITQSDTTVARRLDELRRKGIISTGGQSAFRPLAKRKGALRRFLESRE